MTQQQYIGIEHESVQQIPIENVLLGEYTKMHHDKKIQIRRIGWKGIQIQKRKDQNIRDIDGIDKIYSFMQKYSEKDYTATEEGLSRIGFKEMSEEHLESRFI